MIADRGVASMDFGKDAPDILKKVHMFFGEANETLPLEFEPGLQYGGLYWASRFSGRAVSRVLTKARVDKQPGRARFARR
jgi:hypothetical protein